MAPDGIAHPALDSSLCRPHVPATKFPYNEPSAWSQDPRHLSNGLLGVWDKAEYRYCNDAIKGDIRERQCAGFPLFKSEGDALFKSAGLCGLEHGGIRIEASDDPASFG